MPALSTVAVPAVASLFTSYSRAPPDGLGTLMTPVAGSSPDAGSGLIGTVTSTASTPPCPSLTVTVNESVDGVVVAS